MGFKMRNNIISRDDKKKIISEFLKKCNDYSDQMVDKYEGRLSTATAEEKAALLQKTHDWRSYKDFNQYTVTELEGEVLDDWF